MSRPTATVIEVSRTADGFAHIRLEPIDGKSPKWFVMRQPPANFDAVVGTVLEISYNEVSINGEPWAKRLPRNSHEIVLIARRKA